MLFSKAKDKYRTIDILSQIKRLMGKKENSPITSEVLIAVFKNIDLSKSWRVRLFGSYWDFHYFIKSPVIEKKPFTSHIEKVEHTRIYGEVTDDNDFDIGKVLVYSRITKWITSGTNNLSKEEIKENELLFYVPPSKEVISILEALP